MSVATMASCAEQSVQSLRTEFLSVGMIEEDPSEVDLDFFLSGIKESPDFEMDEAIEAEFELLKQEYDLPSHFYETQLKRMAVEIVRMNYCFTTESLRLRQIHLRARTSWENERRIEAHAIAAKLPRNPRRWRAELLATLHGVRLLLDAWGELLAALKNGHTWSERQRIDALNLMGVSPEARETSDLLPKGENPQDLIRRVEQEIKQLEDRLPNLEISDKFDRRLAQSGKTLSFDRESVAIRRIEAGCQRRFEQLVKALSPYHTVKSSQSSMFQQALQATVLKHDVATSALKTNPSLANAIKTERCSFPEQAVDLPISVAKPAAPAPKPAAPAPAPAASRPAEPPKLSGNRKQRRKAAALARKRG